MTRKYYDAELGRMHEELIRMGEMIEQAIRGANSALIDRDEARAREIIAFDEEIDRQERLVENLCLKLLLSQQPVAGDLRDVSAALKVITDMERIGDHAADLSELALMLDALPPAGNAHITEMAAQTGDMLLSSIEAFVARDEARAREVIAQDDAVDALFLAVKRELIELIRREPGDGELAADLLMAAKYFERIGDHATNIAEWAVFAATGKHVDEEENG